MTTPERLSAEALATYAAWTRDAKATGLIAEINQYGPSYLEIGMLAREVQASRRLAPLHAAAVALGDIVLRLYDKHGGPLSSGKEPMSYWIDADPEVAAFRTARRAPEPQPMQHNDNLRIVREEAEVAVEGDSSQFQHWLILRPGDKVSVIRAKPTLVPQPDEAEREVGDALKRLAGVINSSHVDMERAEAIEALIDAKLAALGRAGK